MGSTKLNLLLDVGFNREVGQEAALYWNKESGDLAGLIDRVDRMDEEERTRFGVAAKERIEKAYSWEFIGDEYMSIWKNRKTK